MLTDLDIRVLMENLQFVRKEGNYLVFFCPFHEDRRNPNFKVHILRGVYRCFACGRYGSARRLLHDLAPELYPLSEQEERESEILKLAEGLFKTHGITDKEILKEIHERRGISWETIEKSEVKFIPEISDLSEEFKMLNRRFLFPIYSFNKRVLNFVGWSPYLKPKYFFLSSVTPKPYGLHFSSSGPVHVCEGVFDVLSFWDIGLPSVGVLGNSVPIQEVFALFPQELVFVPDGDTTGNQYAVRWSFLSLKEKRFDDKVIILPRMEDPNSLHRKNLLGNTVENTRKYKTYEILLYYSLRYPERLSPLFVIQFLGFTLPLPYYLTFITEAKKLLPKEIGVVLPQYVLDGSVPSEEISEQILSDWTVLLCAATTEDGRKIILHYFLPSEIKPLLEKLPVKGSCEVLSNEIRGACRRLLYILRAQRYNFLQELVKKTETLERVC